MASGWAAVGLQLSHASLLFYTTSTRHLDWESSLPAPENMAVFGVGVLGVLSLQENQLTYPTRRSVTSFTDAVLRAPSESCKTCRKDVQARKCYLGPVTDLREDMAGQALGPWLAHEDKVTTVHFDSVPCHLLARGR